MDLQWDQHWGKCWVCQLGTWLDLLWVQSWDLVLAPQLGVQWVPQWWGLGLDH